MKSIGAEFLRPDVLPGVNHMRGMQYQIVIYFIEFIHEVYRYTNIYINTVISNIKM